MSNTAAPSRIKYNFNLVFPTKPFTVESLTARGAKPQYITAYMRVKKALRNGELVVAGLSVPSTPRRGRKELLYKRVDAKTALVTALASSASQQ